MSLPPDLISAAEDAHALRDLNAWLAARSASERVAWALETLPGEHALSSSFGAQSAAVLHLVTRERNDIPVILVDTGYLFPETYLFADQLNERLKLNLKVYRPTRSIAWMGLCRASGRTCSIRSANRMAKKDMGG